MEAYCEEDAQKGSSKAQVKCLLVLVYAALNYACSLEPFKGADFMYTVFFSGSCCILYAVIAGEIDNLFAELFIICSEFLLVFS